MSFSLRTALALGAALALVCACSSRATPVALVDGGSRARDAGVDAYVERGCVNLTIGGPCAPDGQMCETCEIWECAGGGWTLDSVCIQDPEGGDDAPPPEDGGGDAARDAGAPNLDGGHDAATEDTGHDAAPDAPQGCEGASAGAPCAPIGERCGGPTCTTWICAGAGTWESVPGCRDAGHDSGPDGHPDASPEPGCVNEHIGGRCAPDGLDCPTCIACEEGIWQPSKLCGGGSSSGAARDAGHEAGHRDAR